MLFPPHISEKLGIPGDSGQVLTITVGRDSNTSSSTGIIERVLMEDTQAGSTGVTVHANPEHPRYEVRDASKAINSSLLTALLVAD